MNEMVKVRPMGVENPGNVCVEQTEYEFNKVTGTYLMPKRHAMLLRLAMNNYVMMTPELESVRIVEEAASDALRANAADKKVASAKVKIFETRMRAKYGKK